MLWSCLAPHALRSLVGKICAQTNSPPVPTSNIMDKVKRLTLKSYSSIALSSVDIPEILKPKEILIKVCCVGLTQFDYLKKMQLISKYILPEAFPVGIGYDVAGIVEKVGSEITRFKPGQRVCGRREDPGAVAEFTVLIEELTSLIPDNVSFEEAAAFPTCGILALQALRFGNLKRDETIFITGGSTGVGSFAIQLAKNVFKARKIVVTCPVEKLEFCKSIGADSCVDQTSENAFKNIYEEKFDMILDTTGEARKTGRLIGGGRFIVSVAGIPNPESYSRVGKEISFPMKSLFFLGSLRERILASPGIYEYLFINPNSTDLTELFEFLEDGKVKAYPDVSYDGMEKSPEAFLQIKTGKAKGIVLVKLANNINQ